MDRPLHVTREAIDRSAAPSIEGVDAIASPKKRGRPPRARPVQAGATLTWPGRSWRTSESAPGSSVATLAELGLRTIERCGNGDGPEARLVHGDALDVASLLTKEGFEGKVDLVYVDPPYASDRDYVAEARLDGHADGRVTRTLAYEDKWADADGGVGAYLDMLAPRLDGLASLLSAHGTIWVHLDWRAAYLVRSLLDEILGRDAFLNEIVWKRAPNLGRQAASSQFGRTLDTIVVYGKPKAVLRPPTRLEPIEPSAVRWDDEGRPFTTAPRGDYTDASIAKLEAEGRVHRTATGKAYIKYFVVKNEDGVLCRERRVDALWTDVAPLRHAAVAERTGYPTQKPRALLERIIACATEPGAIVVDAFGGSGTTAVAAHATGRVPIVSDRSPVAIATARARLLREGAPVRIDRLPSAVPPGSLEVEVRSSDEGVALVAPREPLAWAVGTETNGTFETLWHAERGLGSKTVPAASRAPAFERNDLRVRVYADDGSIGEARA